MQQFGLSDSNLPPGTQVLFKDPTIWEQHRNFVLASFAVIVLLSAFAGALLLERRSRRRTEGLLAESEERMTFTAAAVNVGLWQFDPDTRELWSTDHCRAMFGLPTEATLTRDAVIDAIHPEDREFARTTLCGTASTDMPGTIDVRIVLPDLQVRWLRMSARAFPRPDHKIKQLSGTFIDITDQKAAEVEAALQQPRSRISPAYPCSESCLERSRTRSTSRSLPSSSMPRRRCTCCRTTRQTLRKRATPCRISCTRTIAPARSSSG